MSGTTKRLQLIGSFPTDTDKDGVVRYDEQNLSPEQQEQARKNIGAIDISDVEELLNGNAEQEFNETGELVELNHDLETGTELNVVSKINRDSTWGESNKLVLHQVSGDNFVDLSSYLGGAGTVFEKNGLTATVNTDSTLTVTGTNTSTGWTNIVDKGFANTEHFTKIYPAGTYFIPYGLNINILAAEYPNYITIPGASGNLSGKITISQPFRVIKCYVAYAGGASVNTTIPLGIFRGESAPEIGRKYEGNIYTTTFGHNVYDGEYNWRTGELKDADGNTVAYYEPQAITSLSGINYFWTGFGENTVSNVSTSNLDKVVIRLGEAAPEETVPSICDFTLTPTTIQAAYGLTNWNVIDPGGALYGTEVPVLTTKGTISVRDNDGNVKYSRYIDPMFNHRGVSDLLTNNGLQKQWSKKYYLTKAPISSTQIPGNWDGAKNMLVHVWEFDETEFESTGIPAKISDIPMATACFQNDEKTEDYVASRQLYDTTPYPAVFSYNDETGKYTLTAKGIGGYSVNALLTQYSKVYFHYQLDTPYVDTFQFAMGIEAGDKVIFEADLSDAQPYIDKGYVYEEIRTGFINEYNIDPSVAVLVPRSINDAMDGMDNIATMLNSENSSSGGDSTAQGYSWIGEGNGVTDYTTRIQQKLDEVHKITNGGTVYLGTGTYKISKTLIVYDNTRIIGNGQTVIEQVTDNTHAIMISGSQITIRDLTINLSGACTDLTSCIFINSQNHPNVPEHYDSTLPINMYVQNLTVEDVRMVGLYYFARENGYDAISDAYENYKGVGIYCRKGYFNYAHVDNVDCEHLMTGVHGGGGSNYYKVTSEFCKYGLYITNWAGNNTYFVDGHPYYSTDANGNHISMSEMIAYVDYDEYSTYHLRTFDTQAYKTLVFLDSRTESNKIDIQISLSTQHGMISSHNWNILKWFIIDYGRANIYNDNFKHTPFHIGSSTTSIAGSEQLELSNPVIQNALSGAGIWGNISSNVEFADKGIHLRDVCRYPSEKTAKSNYLPYILSKAAPSVDSPIEIVVDYSNRPVVGIPNYFIQFESSHVASDYVVSFDTTDTGVYDFEVPVSGNTNVVEYYDYPQIGEQYTTYRMKIRFTKALQITGIVETITGQSFNYNPDGLIGICNIGMTVNDYAGRSFLGECGGSLYGNVDMHQNTLKNLPNPVDDGDAVSKAYLEARLAELLNTLQS